MNPFEKSILPLKEIIYQEVKNKILNLEFKPGQMISESDISEQLKVSRTPVREVFIRLSHEKLLNIYPQKGTFVSLIDLSFVEESVYMRSLLERQIISEIIDNNIRELPVDLKKNLRQQRDLVEDQGSIVDFLELDNEFHRIIFKIIGHETIWDIISTTKIHYNRFRVLTMLEPEMLDKVYKEHCNIVTEIQAGSKPSCEATMKAHHYSGLTNSRIIMDKYPDYFMRKNIKKEP